MRGQNDFRMGPERAVRWQRLLLVDVERYAAERAVIEAGENVGLVLQAAAGGVDPGRTAGAPSGLLRLSWVNSFRLRTCRVSGVSGSRQTRMSVRCRKDSSCVAP